MKEKLKEAMSEANIQNYEWLMKPKYVDGKLVQETVKLVDCTIEQLNGFLKHCDDMLYNDKPSKPGRVMLYDNIPLHIKLANVELCRRFLLSNLNTVDFKLIHLLNDYISNGYEQVQEVFESIPSEFVGLLLNDLVTACLDKLGSFNKKPITLTFILNQGVWLSAEEALEIKGKNKLSKIKDELKINNLDPDLKNSLEIKPDGLSLKEMKALISIKRVHKYRDMTDTQLILLRDKILFILRSKIKSQIKGWDARKNNILKVIEKKREKK